MKRSRYKSLSLYVCLMAGTIANDQNLKIANKQAR